MPAERKGTMALMSVSTGCFRTHDYDAIAQWLKMTSADAIEVIIYNDFAERMGCVRERFQGLGRPISAVHSPKLIQTYLSTPGEEWRGEELVRATVELARDLDSSMVIVHPWDGRCAALDLNAIGSTLARCAEHAGKHGITLSLEALPSRHDRPSRILERLLSFSDKFTYTLDFEYAKIYEMFDELLAFSERLSNVHLRDFDGRWLIGGRRAYVRPFLGAIDFEARINEIKATGYDGPYVVEAPYPTVGELENVLAHFRQFIR
jgi:sugar phosphate isomerase/epimerase